MFMSGINIILFLFKSCCEIDCRNCITVVFLIILLAFMLIVHGSLLENSTKRHNIIMFFEKLFSCVRNISTIQSTV